MGARRGGVIPEDLLRVRIADLAKYDLADIEQACDEIGNATRERGEPLLPEWNAHRVMVERFSRRRQPASGKWQACGDCHEGWLIETRMHYDNRGNEVGMRSFASRCRCWETRAVSESRRKS